jgi:hypothetical protein
MRSGIAAFRASGNRYLVPFFLCLLAEQYARLGRLEQTCAWFGEDFVTRDLIEARSVLAQCRVQALTVH